MIVGEIVWIGTLEDYCKEMVLGLYFSKIRRSYAIKKLCCQILGITIFKVMVDNNFKPERLISYRMGLI